MKKTKHKFKNKEISVSPFFSEEILQKCKSSKEDFEKAKSLGKQFHLSSFEGEIKGYIFQGKIYVTSILVGKKESTYGCKKCGGLGIIQYNDQEGNGMGYVYCDCLGKVGPTPRTDSFVGLDEDGFVTIYRGRAELTAHARQL